MDFANNRFVRAVGTMIGSIVGVGIFGLPFAFAQAGYGVGLLVLLVLVGLNALLLLMYTDIVVHTPGRHRLAGYVSAHLGKGWGRFGLVALAVGVWGSMTAYLMAGGRFLSLLFETTSPAAETTFGLLVLAAVAVISYCGMKVASRAEVAILGILLFLLAFIAVSASSVAHPANLMPAHWDKLLLVYGVVYFSLNGGVAAIPEMKEIMGSGARLPHAVMIGMGWVLAIYALFTLSVVAATGTGTSAFALDALVPLLGGTFETVGSALAVVSVLSIFTLVSIALRHAFQFDLGLRKHTAWALTFLPPAILYLAGLRSFIGLIGFVGSVLAAGVGILVVATYESMRSSGVCRDHACVDLPRVCSVAVVGVYLIGMILTVAQYFV